MKESKTKIPTQPQLIFQRDATVEEETEWLEAQGDYHDTVKNVLTTVVLGSLFQIFTFGMMIFAFHFIDMGLNNPLN